MDSKPLLEVTPIADGLWRWTLPHPEWTPKNDRPDGWPRMVGCVYFESPAGESDALVLVDPLAPPAGSAEAETFWSALDKDVDSAGLPVVIFLGNGYHARSALELRRRYSERHGAEIRAHGDAVAKLGFQPTHLIGTTTALRTGVESFPIEGLDAGETAFFIPRHRALVISDAVLGAGGGRLAVAPLSWAPKDEAAATLYKERFRASLRRLVDLDPAIVLTSHGEPVLAGGRKALVAAIDGPAWGE